MGWKSALIEKRFYYLVGLAGVSPHESRVARYCGRLFSWMMVLAAVVLLSQWQLELLGRLSYRAIFIINWSVFLFFLAVYSTEILLVEDRWRYLRQNWSLPVIVVLGIPFLLGYSPVTKILSALRPILAIYVLFPSIRLLISFFIDGKLRTTLLGAAVVIVIFGLLVAGIDPAIKSPWDGIWWALATVSTVGYGDVVPSSALGRLIGALLVVLGLVIFVIITANILAMTLRKESKDLKREEAQVEELVEDMKRIKKLQAEILKTLKKLKK